MTPEPRVSRWDEARARCDAHTGRTANGVDAASAAFYDHAHADLVAALDAIDAVLALHTPESTGIGLWCSACELQEWPCPTAAALGAE